MEEKIFKFILKHNTDKVRLTELIAHFTHNVSGNEKQTVIFKKLLPALLNMEKEKRIKLSWDVMLSRYRFPRYIYFEMDNPPANQTNEATDEVPLWMKQIEEILKKEASSDRRKVREQRLQDKFERFIKRYDKSSEEITPSDDWIKVITAIMESNLAQYDVMRACIEAFKAGVVWERYKTELNK